MDQIIETSTESRQNATGLDVIYPNRLPNGSIRLLKLLPGENQDPIHVDLFEVSTHDLPPYEAISYVWGDPTICEPIRCNDTNTTVTVNLVSAFRRFRRRDSARVLWADAICINQANILERNHQVKAMRHIYSRAERVLVWLGDDPYGQAKCMFDFIRLVASVARRYKEAEVGDEELAISFEHEDFHNITLDVLKKETEYQLLELDSVVKPTAAMAPHLIFESPWLTRIWCVQEMVVAHEVAVTCGYSEISWENVVTFMMWGHTQLIGGHDIGELVPIFESSVIYKLQTARSSSLGSWPHLLHHFRSWQATDPRDKVFALLGFSNQDNETIEMEIDYGKQVAEVYREAALGAMKHNDDLFILECVDHGQMYDPDSGFPSWVPRWDVQSTSSPLWRRRIRIQSSSTANGLFNTNVFPSTGVSISLRGLFFDNVAWTTSIEAFNYDEFSSPALQFFYEMAFAASIDYDGRSDSMDPYWSGCVKAFIEIFPCSICKVDEQERNSKLKGVLRDFLVRFINPHKESLPSIANLPLWFHASVLRAWWGRRIFTTQNGYVGLGPSCMQPQDMVVVLSGGYTPFVLRPLEDEAYAFIGACFVPEIFEVENFEMLKSVGQGEEERMFTIR